MGACCSIDDSVEGRRERRDYDRNREIIINTAFIHDGCKVIGSVNADKSCYGEFTCPRCGRFWRSTLSWRNNYQVCKRCNTNVYPKNQREVRPTDIKHRHGKTPEHSSDLCQKCKQLGYYCGNNKRSNGQKRSRSLSQTYISY